MAEEKQGAKPRYREAAERLTGGENTGAFLTSSSDRGASKFPGPNCLHPDEVAEFQRTGKLPEAKMLHLATCDPCAAMCEASRPSPERIRAFRDLVPELRPAGELKPAPAGGVWRFSNFVILIGLMTIGGAGSYLMVPKESPVQADKRPVTVPPRPPLTEQSVVVVASAKTDSGQRIRVTTPPITVTADSDSVANTVAASAAVVNHPVTFTAVNQKFENPVEFDPCQRDMVLYYSDLLSQYSKDQEKDGSTDVREWLAEYKKTSKKKAGALHFAFEGDGAHVTCEPGTGMVVKGYAPINETMSAASIYLKTAKKNLDENGTENKMLKVNFDQASVSVEPVKSTLQKFDIRKLKTGMEIGIDKAPAAPDK